MFNVNKIGSSFKENEINGYDVFIVQSQTNVDLALNYFKNSYDEYIDDTLANLRLNEGDFTDTDWKYYIKPYCKRNIWD